MARYTLFAAPDTYAMCAHAMLEEVGADYDLRWVTLFSASPDPDFAAASPHCRTPALVGPHGPLFETGAICLWLAEAHPEAGFLVPPGDPERAAFLQWIHYLASTLQPDVIVQYHPEFYVQDEAGADALRAASMRRLAGVFAVLETALAATPGPWFFGRGPTVPDVVLGMQTVWDVIFPYGIAAFPALARQRAALLARPGPARVLAVHRKARAGRPDGAQ